MARCILLSRVPMWTQLLLVKELHVKNTIYNGKKQMEAHLKKQFPNDTKAVEELFKIMKICSKKIHLLCMLKMVPLWFARFILWSGIADLISPIFRYSRTSTTDMVKSFTSNCDLLSVFSQIFYVGDVACSQSHQHAWTECHIWIYAVCRTQSGEIPTSEQCQDQVQHTHQEPLPVRARCFFCWLLWCFTWFSVLQVLWIIVCTLTFYSKRI